MSRTNEFKEGQKVKIYDRDDKITVYGQVVKVITQTKILVKWDDLSDICTHDKFIDPDFKNIKIVES